jgi:hypothetical protein
MKIAPSTQAHHRICEHTQRLRSSPITCLITKPHKGQSRGSTSISINISIGTSLTRINSKIISSSISINEDTSNTTAVGLGDLLLIQSADEPEPQRSQEKQDPTAHGILPRRRISYCIRPPHKRMTDNNAQDSSDRHMHAIVQAVPHGPYYARGRR